jgi:hypothetical protein
MPGRKRSEYFVDQRHDMIFGKRENAHEDPMRALFVAWVEGTDEDAGLVRPQSYGRAGDVNRLSGPCVGNQLSTTIGALKLVTIFCVRRSSARDMRNANVDSAPWLRLTRSTCNPSQQPPVRGEYNSSPRSLPPMNQSNARCACSYQQKSDVDQ